MHFVVHDDTRDVQASADIMRRMGLAVSKAVGNAVTRNRVKRRFRVLARRYEDMLPMQCDIVVRAKTLTDSFPVASPKSRLRMNAG